MEEMKSEKDEDPGQDDLDRCRREIDAIDGEILSLLRQRLDVAAAIGDIKKKRGLSVFDPVREKAILDGISAKGNGRLSQDAIRDIFTRIILAGRAVQGPLRIAGTEATVSHEAALSMVGNAARGSGIPSFGICIPLMAHNTDDVLMKMRAASPDCDLVEVRLDAMASFDLRKIISSAQKPLLITYRSKKEGGGGDAPYDVRVGHLLEAARLGADYIDVEYTLPLEHRRRLFEGRGRTRIVLSKHFRNGTPSKERLFDLLQKMAATGAHVVKIVTAATAVSDNLRVLGLISHAETLGVRVVAFCMGPLGRISRVACPLLGGAFTFASLGKGEESAAGQINAGEMKGMIALLAS